MPEVVEILSTGQEIVTSNPPTVQVVEAASQVAIQGSLTASKLQVFGHSYGTSFGIADPGKCWSAPGFTDGVGGVLATLLGVNPADETNWAVASARVTHDNQSAEKGGVATVLQKLTRPATVVEPFLASSDVVAFFYGINDAAYDGNVSLEPFKRGLRVAIARARASRVYEETDSTITYSGWFNGPISSTTKNSGTGIKYTDGVTGGGNPLAQFHVPSVLPNPVNVTIGIPVTSTQGGVYTFSIGGVEIGSVDTRGGVFNNNIAGSFMNIVYRIEDVDPGTIISMRVTQINSFAYLDYWSFDADDPPLVLLFNQPYLNDYDAWPTVPALNDTRIDAVNAAIAEVASEFDSTFVVDIASIMSNDNRYYIDYDDSHPNELGHAVIAGEAAKVYSSVRTLLQSAKVAQPRTPQSQSTILGAYKTVFEAPACRITTALPSAVYMLFQNGAVLANGTATSASLKLFRFDDADRLLTGYTEKLRIRAQVASNATSPDVTFTFGLYPVTVAGAANVLTYTLGTVVSGSQIILTPGASQITEDKSSDFTLTDGNYAIGVVLSNTNASNNNAGVTAQLQSRHV